MRFLDFLRLVGLALFASALLMLSGCGGGSGSSSSLTGTTTKHAALTGTVQAPSSQTRGVKAAHSRDTTDPLVPVPGASVSLINLDDTSTPGGKVVDTATTGPDGSYAFSNITPGTNYQVEATKAVGDKTLKLDAIVTAPTTDSNAPAAAPVTHDLTPVSTVAAVTTLKQAAALDQADPTAKHSDLQAVADDLAQKRAASTAPLPDLTNSASVASDANALKQAAAPQGSYAGMALTTAVSSGNTNQKVGDTTRLASLIDSTGNFLVVAIPDKTKNGNGNNSNGNGNNSNGNGNNSGGNGGNGNNSGANNGNGSNGSNGQHDDGKDGNFAIGTVTSDGVVTAVTKDGGIKISGLFTAGVGSGVWQRTDGSQSGTWTLTLLKQPYSGLYSGKYVSTTNTSGPGGGKGDFAILVLDDNTLFISGASHDSGGPITGTGTANSTGAITFQVSDTYGAMVTGSGQIDLTNHSVSGTWSSSAGDMGTFMGRANRADNSDL